MPSSEARKTNTNSNEHEQIKKKWLYLRKLTSTKENTYYQRIMTKTGKNKIRKTIELQTKTATSKVHNKTMARKIISWQIFR